MRKRVCDVAGTIGKNTKVYLNGEKLPIKGFSDYVNLYLGNKDPSMRCYEKVRAVQRVAAQRRSGAGRRLTRLLRRQVNDRWELCVSVSDGQFQQARPACARRGASLAAERSPCAAAGELREQHQHHQGRHPRQLHRRRRGRVRAPRRSRSALALLLHCS